MADDAAKKTYRLAVSGRTGRGDYGHSLDKAWLLFPQVQIVAVADDDRMGLAAAAERLKVEKRYSDWKAMLDETKPDVFCICSRWADQHAEMALYAAERGIHLYMEKPICRSLEEADKIVAACEKAHVRLAVAHPTRYSPKIKAVKQLIQEGKLGEILELRGRGKEDRRGGGEDLYVLGSHILDLMREFAGPPQWCFARVSQAGEPLRKEHVVEGAEGIGPLAGDRVAAMFGFGKNVNGYFASVRNAAGKPSRYGLTIYGAKGVLEILEGTLPSVKFLPDPSWSPGRSKAVWKDVSSAGVDVAEPLAWTEGEHRHHFAIADLFAAIEEQREPICGMYEARGVMEMISGIFESQAKNAPMNFPLATRTNPLTRL